MAPYNRIPHSILLRDFKLGIPIVKSKTKTITNPKWQDYYHDCQALSILYFHIYSSLSTTIFAFYLNTEMCQYKSLYVQCTCRSNLTLKHHENCKEKDYFYICRNFDGLVCWVTVNGSRQARQHDSTTTNIRSCWVSQPHRQQNW